MLKFLRDGYFWTVLGGVIAVLSILFSAFQFYQSTQLNKRTLLGGYALEAHQSYTNLMAAVNQHANGRTEKEIEAIKSADGDLIPAEVRIAFINWEGAWGRAITVDNEIIRVCLSVLSSDVDAMMENEIGVVGKVVNVQDKVAEAEVFADMVVRYILGQSFSLQ